MSGQTPKAQLGTLLALTAGLLFFAGPANPRTTVANTSPWFQKAARLKTPEKQLSEKPHRLTGLLFDGFLKYKTYEFETVVYGSPELLKGGFVHGPGHHTAALAALLFNQAQKPLVVLKTGDLRLPREDRGEPYKLLGTVAGRMDKIGAGSADIALSELAEEVGGEVVGSSFRRLGQDPSPTMALESTECDTYFMAAIRLTSKPSGDGGKMEVPALIGAYAVSPQEAWETFTSGLVSDGSRALVMYTRAFDSIGYLPSHDLYVHDHPELLEKFQTLGLDKTWDPRLDNLQSELPPTLKPVDAVESRINSAKVKERRTVPLKQGEMIDAKLQHAVEESGKLTPVGDSFSYQYLKLNYDRAKIVEFYQDPESGPMVRLRKKVRPVLAFAPGRCKSYRLDVEDSAIPRDGKFPYDLENTVQLGAPSGASSGQSDLYYYYGATEVERPVKPKGEGFVSLASALQACRTGDGDAHTENLLQRLARHLQWNPNLGMSWAELDRFK